MNKGSIRNYDFLKVCLITIAGSTGFFTWGYTNSISNCILPFMSKSLFPLRTTTELSLIASIISIGAAVGAFFGSSIADKYGRRFSLLISDYVFFIGILLTLVHHFETIIVGRILQGIMIGIYSTVDRSISFKCPQKAWEVLREHSIFLCSIWRTAQLSSWAYGSQILMIFSQRVRLGDGLLVYAQYLYW